MPDQPTEGAESVPSIAAAWAEAGEQMQGAEPSPVPVAEGEADTPNPDHVEDAADAARTGGEAEDSGDAEQEQPNGDAEAAAGFDPVLKTLSPEVQEGLRAMSPEARAALAKRLLSSEKNRQDATKEAAELRKSHEALQRLTGGTAKDREDFFRWQASREKGAQQEAPQPMKRPRLSEFNNDEDYEKAMDAYEEAREKRLESSVESRVTWRPRAISAAETAFQAWRHEQGEALPEPEARRVALAVGRALASDDAQLRRAAENPELVAILATAVNSYRSSAAPSEQQPAKPNPAPSRGVRPASVPTARGPARPGPVKPRFKPTSDNPSAAELRAAWEETGEDLAANTPTARNGAMR